MSFTVIVFKLMTNFTKEHLLLLAAFTNPDIPGHDFQSQIPNKLSKNNSQNNLHIDWG